MEMHTYVSSKKKVTVLPLENGKNFARDRLGVLFFITVLSSDI
jgi:hypothetical protein